MLQEDLGEFSVRYQGDKAARWHMPTRIDKVPTALHTVQDFIAK